MSPTRYEWTLVDLAIMYAGAVTVPIYETSSPSQIAWILKDARVKALVAEKPEHILAVETAIQREDLPQLNGMWAMDDGLDDLRALAAQGPRKQRWNSVVPRQISKTSPPSFIPQAPQAVRRVV